MSQPAQALAKAPFRLGKKNVFLPNHVITFHRKDHNPPNWATFEVPLRFNKFDIRDYLWNLYGVETTAVRSWVKMPPVERKLDGRGAAYHPKSIKFMTVELTRPFVWPEVPEDLEPWNKKLWDAREKRQADQNITRNEQASGKLKYPSKEPMTSHRKAVKERAEMLLKGQAEWKTDAVLDEKWEKQA
ncbi:conserved hypothetical protein [Verticillium alfalfae VaMs.102]|uniref:Large ribosomal subunit protein uL23m n=1 Tax=Verticillium alfalfae (strain VaMs.102 / ATCC MYA-4576 / FGSC 10136) TaxID=526221 RepID=C9S7M8_VERA1|nr:conserved hypothetical protein [Verticillium alfalfae VaMs.102]EEY14789.1 conserved hypothetical protein [Verticillium alfalfae VaMs.102]